MSSRAYLSIGDVLTLLREEFPDVTISKIRFLESQGLVNPERSPSGYRKFFEHDVERLRWVLRQQREHFLPLKVIRDRLASGDLGDDLPVGPAAVVGVAPTRATGVVERNGPVTEPAAVGATPKANGASAGRHAAAPGGLRSVAGVGPRHEDESDDEPLTKADSDAMARILADASRRSARLPDAVRPALRAVREDAGTTEPAPRESVITRRVPERAGAPAHAGDAPVPDAAAVAPENGSASRGGRASAEVAAKSKAGAGAVASTPPVSSKATAPSAPAPGAPAPGRNSEPATPGRAPAAGAAPARDASAMSGMVTGASLTAEELCGASGLSEIELANLEGFGLIGATEIAGLATYDEDALTVANLAAELRVFGIEPRHLRLYKNAVDREVGLIEQVIIPLLRQRNPESRQRALDSADQLAALGQTMRATLLRSALRRHVGG